MKFVPIMVITLRPKSKKTLLMAGGPLGIGQGGSPARTGEATIANPTSQTITDSWTARKRLVFIPFSSCYIS